MVQKSYGVSGTGKQVTVKGLTPDTEKSPTFRTDSAMKAKKGAGNVGASNVNN